VADPPRAETLNFKLCTLRYFHNFYLPITASPTAINANIVIGPQKNLNAWSMRSRGLVFLIKIIITNKDMYLAIKDNGLKSFAQKSIIKNKGIV